MFVKILLNYILGYVNIKVESYFIERFVNMCISKKIFLWNIKRKKSTILYANVGIKDYKKLKQVIKKTQSKISIETKKGIPFIMHRYRKRKIFVILLVFVIIGLIIISNFVWNIEIEGNDKVTKEEIIQELNKDGLTIGIPKTKINTNLIINKFRLDRNDIAWIGIDIKGTNVIVKVKETSKAPEVIDEKDYCNITAKKAGLITKINVQNGTALVKEGDIVKEGDTLVAGYVEGKYTGTRYVHAGAEVEAKVWYSKKEKIYLTQEIKVPTGATEQKYAINFNNFKINFYKTLSKFKKYDTISKNKKLVLFSNFYLPIEITKTTNSEYETQEVTYTEEEVVQKAENEIKNELENQIQNKDGILNTKTNTYSNDGFVEVEVIYEVLENIKSESKIIF